MTARRLTGRKRRDVAKKQQIGEIILNYTVLVIIP